MDIAKGRSPWAILFRAKRETGLRCNFWLSDLRSSRGFAISGYI